MYQMPSQPDSAVALRSFSMAGIADVSAEISAFYAEFCAKKGQGGWRRVGRFLGVSGAYARELANGDKPITEDIARTWLTKSGEIHAIIEVQVCPSCGGDHGLTGIPDCHGRPVVAVVTLAPGEVVRQNGHAPRKPRKADDRGTVHLPKQAIDKINARRGTMTQAAYILHLIEGDI